MIIPVFKFSVFNAFIQFISHLNSHFSSCIGKDGLLMFAANLNYKHIVLDLLWRCKRNRMSKVCVCAHSCLGTLSSARQTGTFERSQRRQRPFISLLIRWSWRKHCFSQMFFLSSDFSLVGRLSVSFSSVSVCFHDLFFRLADYKRLKLCLRKGEFFVPDFISRGDKVFPFEMYDVTFSPKCFSATTVLPVHHTVVSCNSVGPWDKMTWPCLLLFVM